MSFRPRTDHELSKLTDEKLIAYVREASRAGDVAASKHALAHLVFGYRAIVRARVALRTPREHVEEVTQEALERAYGAAFAGSSEGEFRAWLFTIAKRTVADWHRRRKRRPKETRLPSEHVDSEDVWGEEPASAGETGALELHMVVQQVMSQLNDTHRRVVELHVFDALSAADVCARIDGMSEGNVAQIASRFRKRLRVALGEGNGGSAG